MRIQNKKAFHNYEVVSRFEAGVVLAGYEVKSIRDGRCNLGDAYVKILSNELWLVNADIARYKYNGSDEYDSTRSRKLLVSKRELYALESKLKQGNLTLIPLSIYSVGNRIKVEVGVCKGLKRFEKKIREKERVLEMELHREKRKYMI